MINPKKKMEREILKRKEMEIPKRRQMEILKRKEMMSPKMRMMNPMKRTRSLKKRTVKPPRKKKSLWKRLSNNYSSPSKAILPNCRKLRRDKTLSLCKSWRTRKCLIFSTTSNQSFEMAVRPPHGSSPPPLSEEYLD